MPAHPRSRGENSTPYNADTAHTGSSPLTRGKQVHAIRCRFRRGLIPAHAGKTEKAGIPASLGSAHPRSRGENSGMVVVPMVTNGSSPLTRGKPALPVALGDVSRLIPAHAGKTYRHFRPRPHSGAHPRSRGENWPCRRRRFPPEGSSPLTRGKPPCRRGGHRPRGLIPAHAGKTLLHWLGLGALPAHPRSRGENYPPNLLMGEEAGSSPLTRGKRHFQALNNLSLRLIPAHAGKTEYRPV